MNRFLKNIKKILGLDNVGTIVEFTDYKEDNRYFMQGMHELLRGGDFQKALNCFDYSIGINDTVLVESYKLKIYAMCCKLGLADIKSESNLVKDLSNCEYQTLLAMVKKLNLGNGNSVISQLKDALAIYDTVNKVAKEAFIRNSNGK